MSYAIRNDNQGWRSVNVPDEVLADEYYSDEPIEIVPVVVIPSSVSAFSALLAIDQAGLSVKYSAWADSTERTFSERAFIEKATTWERGNEITVSALKALKLSSQDADSLFIAAAGIK